MKGGREESKEEGGGGTKESEFLHTYIGIIHKYIEISTKYKHKYEILRKNIEIQHKYWTILLNYVEILCKELYSNIMCQYNIGILCATAKIINTKTYNLIEIEYRWSMINLLHSIGTGISKNMLD